MYFTSRSLTFTLALASGLGACASERGQTTAYNNEKARNDEIAYPPSGAPATPIENGDRRLTSVTIRFDNASSALRTDERLKLSDLVEMAKTRGEIKTSKFRFRPDIGSYPSIKNKNFQKSKEIWLQNAPMPSRINWSKTTITKQWKLLTWQNMPTGSRECSAPTTPS